MNLGIIFSFGKIVCVQYAVQHESVLDVYHTFEYKPMHKIVSIYSIEKILMG